MRSPYIRLLLLLMSLPVVHSFYTAYRRRWGMTEATAPVKRHATVQPVSPSAQLEFNSTVWKDYEDLIAEIKSKIKLNKKNKDLDVTPVFDYVLSRDHVLPTTPVMRDDEAVLLQAMETQQLSFMEATNMNRAQYDHAQRVLSYVADWSAKRQNNALLPIAWNKILHAGMLPRENTLSTYMYTFFLHPDTMHLSGEVATLHNLLYAPNEKTILLRIKTCIAADDAIGAQGLLKKLPQDELRLRTHLPIMSYYCSHGVAELRSALQLYRQMCAAPSVHFDSDFFALLIGSIAQHGGFSQGSEPLESDDDETNGPLLLDKLCSEMADNVLELNNASARVLYNSFASGYGLEHLDVDEETGVPCNNEPASADEVIVSRVMVDETTAVCPRSLAKLRLLQLEPEQRTMVEESLVTMAQDQYKEFQQAAIARSKNLPELDMEVPLRELTKFMEWLQNSTRTFTAIIDGANVAYSGHNHAKLSQIDQAIKRLEDMNETPLVVLPQKYAQPRYRATHNRKLYSLSDRELALLDELEDAGKLYKVPPGCLDDYYWMIASVIGSEFETIQADNSKGRYPGIRPMLISNDQMRDHRLALLEPRLFRRWYSSHIVNYNFTEPFQDEWEERPIEFCAADFFSREIQGNPSGDDASLAWHFPVKEWNEHERLCIRIR